MVCLCIGGVHLLGVYLLEVYSVIGDVFICLVYSIIEDMLIH